MRMENFDIFKELCFDEYVIKDLDSKIDNVRKGNKSDYNRGYYMGYIFSLYDMGPY